MVCSVRALYSNLNSQMRMQITQPARDMKYADRFFFRDEDGAVDLIRAVSRQLQKLSSSVQVFGSRDYRRGDSSSGADELDAATQSFKELASDFDRQLLWLERRGQTADLSFCPKNTKDILKKLYFSSKILSHPDLCHTDFSSRRAIRKSIRLLPAQHRISCGPNWYLV